MSGEPRLDAHPGSAAERLRFALDAAISLSSSLEPREVIADLLARALDLVDADRATLSSLEGDEILIEATHSRPAEGATWIGRRYSMDYLRSQPLVLEAIESGRAVVGGPMDAGAAAPEFQDALERSRQTVTIPLMLGGRAVGLLVVSRGEQGSRFEEGEVTTLQLLGNAAALALRNARLYSEAEDARERNARVARTLSVGVEMALDLSEQLDLREVQRRLLRRAVDAVGADRGTLVALEADRSVVVDSHAVGGVEPVPIGLSWPLEGLDPEREVKQVTQAVSRSDPGFPADPALAGVEHLLTIPLVLRGRVVAILVMTRLRGEPFGAEDVATLQQIGNVAVLARQNAVLYEQLERTARRLEVGIETALDVATEVQLQQVVHRLLVRGAEISGADRITLCTLDGADLVIEDSLGPDGSRPIEPGARLEVAGQPLIVDAFRRGQALQATSVDLDRIDARYVPELGRLRHFATVPLVFQGAPAGALNLSRYVDEPFTDEQLAQLSLMGQIAVLAIRNARLFEALEEASRSKSEFLNLAAHELRTPLTVVTGYVSLLRDGSLGPAPEAWGPVLAVISEKTAELGALVDSLLVAARLQAGSLVSRPEAADLVEVVQAAAARARASIKLATGRLEVSLPEGPAMATVDSEQVGRILDNLLNNAIAYSSEKPWVGVRLTVHEGVADIEIEDRGRGIRPEDQERIFEQFVRVEDPELTFPPGTGLGLYISRGLARRHGGDLELIRSARGEGSLFRLRLPLEASPD